MQGHIIQVRGTNGSGKTHLVKRLIADVGTDPVEDFVAGRKRPIRTMYPRTDGKRSLLVPGHYYTACGGADSLPGMDKPFEIVREGWKAGFDVAFEGLLVSPESRQGRTLGLIEMAGASRVHIIVLNTPMEECLASINARRRAKDPDAEDVKPDNIVGKHKAIVSGTKWLRSQGVDMREMDREAAYLYCRAVLELE